MIQISDLMTSKLFTLQPSDNLEDVRALMRLAQINHIIVTDTNGHFLGLVTHRDLLAHAVSDLADIEPEERSELEANIKVGEIMRKNVATIYPDTRLREAAKMMADQKLECLPVLEGAKAVGIITASDFIKLAVALLPE